MTAPALRRRVSARRYPASARRRPVSAARPIPTRRLQRTILLAAVLLAAVLLAAVLLAAVLAFSDDQAPNDPLGIAPLRVTSGNEIATGFAVGGDRVVTVAHVLDGPLAVDRRRARVLRADRRSDLALLSVPGLAPSAVPADSGGASSIAVDPAPAGARLRILRVRGGRSSSLSVRVRRAIVAHVRAPGAARAVTRPALELAAQVAAGDSGAPVVSRSGALAGVIFAASRRRDGVAYAVDARALARLLRGD